MLNLKRYLLYTATQRISEMLIGCIVPSVLICALCVSGPMPVGSLQRDAVLIAAPLIFMAWNVLMLRRCYAELADDVNYYVVNLCAYGAFALINLIAYIFLPTDGYTWIFVITRFLRYSNLGISTPVGIILFHIITAVSIFFAPLGMNWIFEAQREAEEFEETLPPRLEVNTSEIPANKKESVDEEENKKKTQNTV